MIVVEGPDGAGKTNLISTLSKDLMIPVHKRASSPTGGPVENLWEWAYEDVTTMHRQRFQIYDRHPLISEYIYGPITREEMDGRFFSTEAVELCRLFHNSVIVVFCDPGVLEVEKNVVGPAAPPHMPGVADNWRRIYYSYRALMTHWDGNLMTWDYRYMALYPYIRSQCVNFMATKKTEFQR